MSTNFLGAWNPNTVYWGAWLDDAHTQPHPGGADEVAYQGAQWIANYYNEDLNPVADQPGDGGAWMLDPNGPAIVYDEVVPDAPTGLKAGFTSADSVALSWTASEVHGIGDVTSYEVFENGVKIAATTSTAFTVSGLTASTAYNFTVDAVDLSGASVQGGTLAVTTHGAETASGKYFSPFVDMTLPTTDLAQLSADSGLRDFTLAFMQTSKDGLVGNDTSGDLAPGAVPSVSWGGLTSTTLPTGTIIDEVREVETQGGTVTISFGGFNGRDPAVIARQYSEQLQSGAQHDSAATADRLAVAHLQEEYQSVIDTYGIHSLDFDIENQAVVNDHKANQLRDLAIKGLEATNPGLKITFTLATLPNGLAATDGSGGGNDLNVLAQAKADGVHIDVVNIMAMDYFDGDANDMGDNAISAARAVERQVTAIGLDAKIGITPMIGQNDDFGAAPPGGDGVSEIFTLADAHKLEAFAATTPWVAGLGMWELPRDSASSTDTTGQAPISTASGLVQSAFEFSSIFDPITTAAPVASHVIKGDSGANRLHGTAHHDVIDGFGGNDVLSGLGGADTLNGGAGRDVLNGGAGADTMRGGTGNDTYVVDSRHDRVIETRHGGTDLVRSSLSHTLGANVENLTLTGRANITGTGNSAGNHITGNAGANHLAGGAGSDVLKGGAGNDTFVFNTALAKAGVDTIADFSHGHDHISLDNAVFAALGPTGHLDADFFVENATGKATTHDQHVVYDSKTGALFYDQDGSGGHAAVHFATLAHHPAMVAADFLVT